MADIINKKQDKEMSEVDINVRLTNNLTLEFEIQPQPPPDMVFVGAAQRHVDTLHHLGKSAEAIVEKICIEVTGTRLEALLDSGAYLNYMSLSQVIGTPLESMMRFVHHAFERCPNDLR